MVTAMKMLMSAAPPGSPRTPSTLDDGAADGGQRATEELRDA
jgi:hypothetical protein